MMDDLNYPLLFPRGCTGGSSINRALFTALLLVGCASYISPTIAADIDCKVSEEKIEEIMRLRKAALEQVVREAWDITGQLAWGGGDASSWAYLSCRRRSASFAVGAAHPGRGRGTTWKLLTDDAADSAAKLREELADMNKAFEEGAGALPTFLRGRLLPVRLCQKRKGVA